MSSHAQFHEDVSLATDAAGNIRHRLIARIGSHRFDMWFGTTTMRISGTTLNVTTDSQFVAQWIEGHFHNELSGIAREVLGEHADVKVSMEQTPMQTAPVAAKPAIEVGPVLHKDEPETYRFPAPTTSSNQPGIRQGRRNGAQSNLRRLDDLVVGASNRLAYSAARSLAEDLDAAAISPLFIHGECGVGKTHLLQGVCRQAATVFGARNVRYVTGEQFTNEFIAAVRNQNIDSFRDRVRKLDLLAIDDVQFLSNKSRTQSEFLHTIDAIGHLGARIVLASNEHPRQISKFSPSLVSRLLAGMVVQVDAPDRVMRLKLVKHIAAKRRLLLLDAAAELIATRCVGSVRELEGVVTKLAAISSLTNADGDGTNEIGLLLVEQLLSEHRRLPAPVRIGAIVDAVCARLGVSRGDLTGTGRHRRVVLARSLVAFLGRELTTMSFPEIAQAMGRAHHSTIHTAASRLSRQLEANERIEVGGQDSDMPLRDLVDQLRHSICRNG